MTDRAHRKLVGRALMGKAQAYFGPTKKIVHIGDTSRVSGTLAAPHPAPPQAIAP